MATKAKYKARGKSKKRINDDEWICLHFEKLVEKYAGKYVVVAEGELFVGDDARELFNKARKKHPNVTPTGMPIPRPEDFVCLL